MSKRSSSDIDDNRIEPKKFKNFTSINKADVLKGETTNKKANETEENNYTVEETSSIKENNFEKSKEIRKKSLDGEKPVEEIASINENYFEKSKEIRRKSLGGEKPTCRKKSLTDGKLKRKGSVSSGPSPKRRCVTRNQCVCSPPDAEPARSQLVVDHDAHMLVEEWRLHKFQSPIELSHEESISHDHFEPLEFHGHWDDEGIATFSNTGKTAVLRFSDRAIPYLVGGPLHHDTYLFEQLHFHWSDDDTSGCEHIFEGKAYSMEAHAVHYNQKYGDFKNAADKPDGLAVVGFFLEATDNEDNPCFSEMTKGVLNITKINSSTNVAPDCLNWIKEEAQCKGYYTYQGSLTTEPYLESVTWILYDTPIHVSREQVAFFRDLKSTVCEKVNIVNNVRPVQSPPADKKINVIYARSHKKSD